MKFNEKRNWKCYLVKEKCGWNFERRWFFSIRKKHHNYWYNIFLCLWSKYENIFILFVPLFCCAMESVLMHKVLFLRKSYNLNVLTIRYFIIISAFLQTFCNIFPLFKTGSYIRVIGRMKLDYRHCLTIVTISDFLSFISYEHSVLLIYTRQMQSYTMLIRFYGLSPIYSFFCFYM